MDGADTQAQLHDAFSALREDLGRKIIGQADSNRFIKNLESGKPVILVVHTGAMITREASATLGKVLLSMIQSFVGRVYLSNRQKVNPPLSIFIDEAQSLLYQGVEELFAKAGSAGGSRPTNCASCLAVSIPSSLTASSACTSTTTRSIMERGVAGPFASF